MPDLKKREEEQEDQIIRLKKMWQAFAKLKSKPFYDESYNKVKDLPEAHKKMVYDTYVRLKTEYNKIAPNMYNSALEVKLAGSEESKRSAGNILDETAKVLAAYDEYFKKVVKVETLSPDSIGTMKPQVFDVPIEMMAPSPQSTPPKRSEQEEQAIITEIMLDEIVSSLKKFQSHLEKDPSKLSKTDREMYIDPEKNVEGYSHFKQVYESLQRNPIESVLIKDENGVEKNGIAIAKKATHAIAHFDRLQASAEATLHQEQSDYKLAVELQAKEKTNNLDAKYMDSFEEKVKIAQDMQQGELKSLNMNRIQEIGNMMVYSPEHFSEYLFKNDSNKTFVQENSEAILEHANNGLTQLKNPGEYEQAQKNIQFSKELIGVRDEVSKPTKSPRR